MNINELWLRAITCLNLTNNAEQKKPNSKTHILYNSIYTKFETGESGHSFGKQWGEELEKNCTRALGSGL